MKWAPCSELNMTSIVSGGCKSGVDAHAERFAREHDIPITVFPADWSMGRAAGPIRNTKIVQECAVIVAFWDGKSRGTADTIRKAEAANKTVLKFIVNDETC